MNCIQRLEAASSSGAFLDKTLFLYDDLSSRSQLLIEAFDILNIYFASTFGPSPFQAQFLM